MAERALINRDPLAPVEMYQMQIDGKPSDTYAVRMLDEQGQMQTLPGLSARHSKDYTLIPNQQVYDLVSDILTRSGRNFLPVPEYGTRGHSKATYWDGRRYSAKWYCPELGGELPGGHAVAMGIEAVNSYDSTQPVGIHFFAMHVLCSNQFYASNMLTSFVFRHVEREAGIRLQDNVTDTLHYLRQQSEQFMRCLPMFGELTKKHVSDKADSLQGFLGFRNRINVDCWTRSRDADVLDELQGRGITAELGIKQLQSDPSSYWNILNAYTAVSTHGVGGFAGANLSDRVTQFVLNDAGVKVPAAA